MPFNPFRAIPVPVPTSVPASQLSGELDEDAEFPSTFVPGEPEDEDEQEQEQDQPDALSEMERTDTDDLFSVTNEDVMGEGDESLDDLFNVTDKDIMGDTYPGQPNSVPRGRGPNAPRFRRTTKRYFPPTIGGVRR